MRKVKTEKIKNNTRTLKNRFGRWVNFRLSTVNPKKAVGVRLQWTDKDNPPRQDKQFKTLHDAELFLQAWEREELAIAGKQTQAITNLNQVQIRDAEIAFSSLPKDMTLTKVVEFYNTMKPQKNSTVITAYEEWLKECERKNLRSSTIKQRKDNMAPFLKKHGWQQCTSITEKIVKKFITKKNPNTSNSYYSVFAAFFNYCIAHEHLKVSPMKKIDKVKVDPTLPAILNVSQVTALIKAAKEYRNGQLLSYTAIACFCGLRPEEIHGGLMGRKKSKESRPLERKQVYLDSDQPTIRMDQTKTRRPRIISIPNNCVKLLKSVEELPIFPDKIQRNHFRKIKISAGVNESWVADIMRHTWASHLYAKDPEKGSSQISNVAGNSQWVAERHYINPNVTTEDAKEYFRIM